jgi:hypothetical protein
MPLGFKETTMAIRYEAIDGQEAAVLSGGYLPPGYMKAVVRNGQSGWLRHLKLGVFLFQPVDEFRFGTGVGAVRRML